MNQGSRAFRPSVVLVTALVYIAAGWLSLQMALAPSYAAPLYPSAGIALATVLVYGRSALWGSALGAFAVNLTLSADRGQSGAAALLVPLVIGSGAAAQAGLGAWLARRHVSQPLTLEQPRDVLRFLLLAAVLACMVSATFACAALWFAGTLPTRELAHGWWTWWVGDSLGALIGAPVALTLIGRPRGHWRPRRLSVALPLLLLSGLLVAASLMVDRWEDERRRAAFVREASRVAQDVHFFLQGPLQALQAVRGLFLANPATDAAAFQRGTAWWLRQPLHLQAIGFSERVPRADVPAFEDAVRAEGVSASYRVHDRKAAEETPADATDAVVAVRYVEPRDGNVAALGLNSLSVPAAAEAIERARRSAIPSASRGFRLTQEAGEQRGVVIYQALYRDAESGATVPPEAALRGVVFVALRMDDAMNALKQQTGSTMRWCLVDTQVPAGQGRLAGPAGCDSATRLKHAYDRVLEFAGRRWVLQLDATASQVAVAGSPDIWLLSVLGLTGAAVVGALLLIVTGRARRVELAVDERTAELRHEIAERGRSEEALRASEQQLQAILDSARVGIVKTNVDGQILKANPAYCRMLEYAETELLEMTVGQLTHPDDRAEDDRLREEIRRGECDVYRREKRFVSFSGKVVHVQLSVALLRDAAGQPEFTVGVVDDIGEHLQLAEAERAREVAESSNRAKSEFVSRMSHELRTPLNAMLGFAQLLGLDRKPQLAEHQRAWAMQIQQAGWHLLHMINDTLDLSRIESGMLKLEPVALELAPLVHSALAMVEPAASKRALHFEEKLDRRARAVLGDETRIKQILTNLLSNAIKYNVEGGHVQVRTRPGEARSVEIIVSDTGLGMTRVQMDGLFQPYNRLGRESSAVEGTGIGLVISRRLAEVMGGSLRVHSVAGEGSTFILTLPRAVLADSELSTGGEMPTPPAEYRQRAVHYIEDNETNIEVMRGMLMRRPQVRLGVSTTGLDGLAAVRQQHPSLILLDMHLPDIDGLELLRHLKNDDDLCHVPVVVVSADATTSHIEQALTAGAAHYVTKPVNLAAFLAIIDELLDDVDTAFG